MGVLVARMEDWKVNVDSKGNRGDGGVAWRVNVRFDDLDRIYVSQYRNH